MRLYLLYFISSALLAIILNIVFRAFVADFYKRFIALYLHVMTNGYSEETYEGYTIRRVYMSEENTNVYTIYFFESLTAIVTELNDFMVVNTSLSWLYKHYIIYRDLKGEKVNE